MTSYWKYLIPFERVMILIAPPLFLYGYGKLLCKFAKDGDKSSLHRHAVLTSNFSAQMELLCGRISIAGHLSLLYFTIPSIDTELLMTKTISSHYSISLVVYAKLTSL